MNSSALTARITIIGYTLPRSYLNDLILKVQQTFILAAMQFRRSFVQKNTQSAREGISQLVEFNSKGVLSYYTCTIAHNYVCLW